MQFVPNGRRGVVRLSPIPIADLTALVFNSGKVALNAQRPRVSDLGSQVCPEDRREADGEKFRRVTYFPTSVTEGLGQVERVGQLGCGNAILMGYIPLAHPDGF